VFGEEKQKGGACDHVDALDRSRRQGRSGGGLDGASSDEGLLRIGDRAALALVDAASERTFGGALASIVAASAHPSRALREEQ
jgi:hypothetical protein